MDGNWKDRNLFTAKHNHLLLSEDTELLVALTVNCLSFMFAAWMRKCSRDSSEYRL